MESGKLLIAEGGAEICMDGQPTDPPLVSSVHCMQTAHASHGNKEAVTSSKGRKGEETRAPRYGVLV